MGGVTVFPIADKNTVYPISLRNRIRYYGESVLIDKKKVKGLHSSYPNTNERDTEDVTLTRMGFTSVSDWVFEGLRGAVYTGDFGKTSNQVYFDK
ncbi:hypothetical protein FACS1894187_16890 [Synergistales bacterium]|nr:hypothetical protein FACS1894187_16890 [Synergistales bacterium]